VTIGWASARERPMRRAADIMINSLSVPSSCEGRDESDLFRANPVVAGRLLCCQVVWFFARGWRDNGAACVNILRDSHGLF
jgi:hypothetical protein